MHLPRDKFEVTVFALDNRTDPVADAIRGAADRYIDCSGMTLRETEELIAQQEQDVRPLDIAAWSRAAKSSRSPASRQCTHDVGPPGHDRHRQS